MITRRNALAGAAVLLAGMSSWGASRMRGAPGTPRWRVRLTERLVASRLAERVGAGREAVDAMRREGTTEVRLG